MQKKGLPEEVAFKQMNYGGKVGFVRQKKRASRGPMQRGQFGQSCIIVKQHNTCRKLETGQCCLSVKLWGQVRMLI